MEYNIEDFLSQNGYKPKYRRLGYGMYLSPLRNEKTASFKVDYGKNLWYDFGTGEGGGIVELCKRMKHCSAKEAMDELHPFSSPKINIEKQQVQPLKIVSEAIIHSPSLINYLEERKIPFQIARAYCSELLVSNGNKQHLVIGFKNNQGGWEMRNKYLKISSSPKTISTIYNEGNNVCNVFEGFMDFLSLEAMSENRGIEGSSVVLNSVSNIARAIPELRGFTKLNCYLDNDNAGRNAFNFLKNTLGNCVVEDCSIYYRGYKDLNDCLTGKLSEVQEKEKDAHMENRIRL